MATLTLTFEDGTKSEFPFHTGSQLSVRTPDGVNGEKYGSWGEITGLELAATTDAVAEPQPVVADPVEPDLQTTAAVADAPAEPQQQPAPVQLAPDADAASDPQTAGTEPDSGSATNSDTSPATTAEPQPAA